MIKDGIMSMGLLMCGQDQIDSWKSLLAENKAKAYTVFCLQIVAQPKLEVFAFLSASEFCLSVCSIRLLSACLLVASELCLPTALGTCNFSSIRASRHNTRDTLLLIAHSTTSVSYRSNKRISDR